MKLKNLQLRNFRNYEKLELVFDDNINIFIGNNAQGKTNILESIYILAITKSHRVFIDDNLIKTGSDILKIKGTILDQDVDKIMQITISKKEKKVKINDNNIKRLSDYISNLNIIMFCPDDLEIIKGSPINRRNFLNIEIGQMFNKYLKILNEYNKILKNRNEYLKLMYINKLTDKIYFDILTEKLIDNSIEIYFYRKNFIDDINKKIEKIYKNITDNDNLHLIYNCFINDHLNDGGELKKTLMDRYNSIFKKELETGTTIIGPHKDDFTFYLGNEELKKFGSQGQQRAAVLSLKLSEIAIFYNKTKKYPILLLDDIFSELDEVKKNNLIKYINSDFQTIITSTDINDIDINIIKNSKIFYVDQGNVTDYKEEVNLNDRKKI
jgi:DNA replication and repair protein RecF